MLELDPDLLISFSPDDAMYRWSLPAGIDVAIIRAFPANAALFVGYELSRKLMSW